MKDGAFKGPFDAGGYTRRGEAAELYLAQAAARRAIDSCGNLSALEGDTVAETARGQIVHDLLVRAMVAYIGTMSPRRQDLYVHLCRKETFGIGGGCWDVAPVFGYLLNCIHGGKVTRTADSLDHAMLLTRSPTGGLQYLDATWRQGRDNRQHKPGTAIDPREKLPLVKVTNIKPTMGSLDEAVTEALGQRAVAEPLGIQSLPVSSPHEVPPPTVQGGEGVGENATT